MCKSGSNGIVFCFVFVFAKRSRDGDDDDSEKGAVENSNLIESGSFIFSIVAIAMESKITCVTHTSVQNSNVVCCLHVKYIQRYAK